MKPATYLLLIALLLSLAGIAALLGQRPLPALPALDTAGDSAPGAAASDFAHMPVLFAENRGQTDGQVRYHSVGTNRPLFATDRGVTLRGGELGDDGALNDNIEQLHASFPRIEEWFLLSRSLLL